MMAKAFEDQLPANKISHRRNPRAEQIHRAIVHAEQV